MTSLRSLLSICLSFGPSASLSAPPHPPLSLCLSLPLSLSPSFSLSLSLPLSLSRCLCLCRSLSLCVPLSLLVLLKSHFDQSGHGSRGNSKSSLPRGSARRKRKRSTGRRKSEERRNPGAVSAPKAVLAVSHTATAGLERGRLEVSAMPMIAMFCRPHTSFIFLFFLMSFQRKKMMLALWCQASVLGIVCRPCSAGDTCRRPLCYGFWCTNVHCSRGCWDL